jgi:1-deoxy-D-xylulose-5-phosphate reductoisomerase
MKKISLLGSTGSIGTQALDIVRQNPLKFRIISLACNKNIEMLKGQIEEFDPEFVVVFDKEKADLLKAEIPVYSGLDGLVRAAKSVETDAVLNSLVGSIGVIPTYKAIKAKKDILLANKETLVTAGDRIMEQVRRQDVALNPIDSEHSAIFQSLNGEKKEAISRLILTCSGGAFRNRTRDQMKSLKADDALKHPNWNMGKKITIDSATLMNKGFEVIEARMLFGIPYENIDVVIHPESIIHSLVEFIDTSVIAQIGWPDMKIPIQYALSHPERIRNNLKPLDLAAVSQLNFKKPDLDSFPCLGFAYEAGRTGGTMPAVMNAANEIAVEYFLQDKISFLDIPRIIREEMDNHKIIKHPGVDEIMAVDAKIKKDTKKGLI